MRLIDGDALYERICDLEAQALSYVGKIGNDETMKEEWRMWSAILAERTAFKHDVFDAPTIELKQEWTPCSERLPEHNQRIIAYYPENKSIMVINYNAHGFTSMSAWMSLPEPYRGERRTDG